MEPSLCGELAGRYLALDLRQETGQQLGSWSKFRFRDIESEKLVLMLVQGFEEENASLGR